MSTDDQSWGLSHGPTQFHSLTSPVCPPKVAEFAYPPVTLSFIFQFRIPGREAENGFFMGKIAGLLSFMQGMEQSTGNG